MKGQKHNQGRLKELRVKIEADVVNSLERMSKNTRLPVDELVVIALKRYRSSHSDYEGELPPLDLKLHIS